MAMGKVRIKTRRHRVITADEWASWIDYPDGDIIQTEIFYRGTDTVYMTDDDRSAKVDIASNMGYITLPTQTDGCIPIRIPGELGEAIHFRSGTVPQVIEFVITYIPPEYTEEGKY